MEGKHGFPHRGSGDLSSRSRQRPVGVGSGDPRGLGRGGKGSGGEAYQRSPKGGTDTSFLSKSRQDREPLLGLTNSQGCSKFQANMERKRWDGPRYPTVLCTTLVIANESSTVSSCLNSSRMTGDIMELRDSTRDGGPGDPHTKYLHFIRGSWKFKDDSKGNRNGLQWPIFRES